jgi:hypothetical protein
MAHPTKAASNTCSKCGHWLCDDCAVETGGRTLCRSCITAMEGNTFFHEPPPEPIHGHVVGSAERRRYIDGFMLFLLSLLFPPGANYMYMGLIKRGLAAMCGFFLLIFCIIAFWSFSYSVLFAFSIPILWFTVFFDGYNLRRRINSGEIVEDGVGDAMKSILNNRALAVAILIIVVLAFAGNIFSFLFSFLKIAVPVSLVLLALYIIFRRK